MNRPLMSIPLEHLKALIPFHANNDVRYYLDGILVQPCEGGGCLLVATDGHMLAVLKSEGAWIDKARILKVTETTERALKAVKTLGTSKTAIVPEEDGRLVILGESRELFIQPESPWLDYEVEKYPNWLKVIPPVERLVPGTSAVLNGAYLATLKCACPDSRWMGAKFWHDPTGGEYAVHVARLDQLEGLVVVIMPMKSQAAFNWPDWMPREPKKEEAAA